MAIRKAAIVFNAKGGSAKGSIADSIVRNLERHGMSVERFGTTPEPNSANHLARQASAGGAELVIAIGGDGTVCQVAEGLIGTGTCMAAYPGGTGNLFARTYYSKPEPARFAEMLAQSQPQGIDMIRLQYTDLQGHSHDRLFMTALGLGPLSDATLISQDVKRVFGKLAYAGKVAAASLALKPVKFSLAMNEGNQTRDVNAAVLVVTNVLPPSMSLFSRGCNASDGMMDATFIEARHFFDLIPTVGRTLLGSPEHSRHYGRVRTPCLQITSDQPVIPNIDGDASPATRQITLTVVPQAARMLLS